MGPTAERCVNLERLRPCRSDLHLLEFVLGCSQSSLLLFQLACGSLQEGLFGLHDPVDAPVNLKVKRKGHTFFSKTLLHLSFGFGYF